MHGRRVLVVQSRSSGRRYVIKEVRLERMTSVERDRCVLRGSAHEEPHVTRMPAILPSAQACNGRREAPSGNEFSTTRENADVFTHVRRE